VAAKVPVQHDDTAAGNAGAIDEAERRIREGVPAARVIYLEPDLRRPADQSRSGATATPQG
jgi:lipoate synthase